MLETIFNTIKAVLEDRDGQTYIAAVIMAVGFICAVCWFKNL